MGARSWMLAYVDGRADEILKSYPQPDRLAAAELVSRLFPSDRFEVSEDGELCYTCPGEDEVYVGCFPGMDIVAAVEFALDYPSRLPGRFLEEAGGRTVYLHAMHSVVDWFAFAKWEAGKLVRSLSLSPDSGILEDLGQRLAFEEPYWSGAHPVSVQYPLPFHPLELGEEALLEFFGYQLEGNSHSFRVQPDEISLVGFKR